MSRGSGLAIERVAETGSTNSDLLERIRALAAAGADRLVPLVLVADRQSAGRGRHGRTWHATPGASLTFSLAWPFARRDLSGLSLAVGTVLADSLDAAAGPARLGLKWPNDLWLLDDAAGSESMPGRKLAGVLIETAPLGATRVAVIGVGVNVLPQAVADTPSGSACWAEIEPAATPDAALGRIVAPLAAALERFEADGLAAFAAAFARRDLLRGRCVVARGPRGPVEGIAAGVSDRGELLLEGRRGLVLVGSGEVRVRLVGGSGDASRSRQAAGSTC